jgi:hypothetical protein
MSLEQMTEPENDLSKLSIEELQQQLKQSWVRFERTVKDEMAPRLYYLRERLKRQGARNGQGFSRWVKDNLGLSISTVNRWANDYSKAIDGKKPSKSKATSALLNRSGKSLQDGQQKIGVVLPNNKWEELLEALQALDRVEVSQLIYDTIMARYKKECKKQLAKAA